MSEDLKKQIESLIAKSEKAEKSEDALRFSQAALNSANAVCSMNAANKGE